MTISAVSPNPSANPQRTGMAALGQGDFLRLMTTQMQQQDPFNPVDQKEMLAQMAQFSALAGQTEMNETLKAIAEKLDAVLTAQEAAASAAATPSATPPAN